MRSTVADGSASPAPTAARHAAAVAASPPQPGSIQCRSRWNGYAGQAHGAPVVVR